MKNSFVNFLVKAKKATYANKSSKEKKLKEGSKQLTFEEGNFKYVDTYYGSCSFVGKEIIFEKQKITWVMNYYGKVLSKKVSPKKTYNFLKKALSKVSKKNPFRGPKYFRDSNFKYINEFKGNINCFNGTEKIFYKNKEIYILKYHGGFIE